MIDSEGKYRGVEWSRYDEGKEPFVADIGAESLRATHLSQLQSKIDEYLDTGRREISIKLHQVMDPAGKLPPHEKQPPRYSDILQRYGRAKTSTDTPQPRKPKLLSAENREKTLALVREGIDSYFVESEKEQRASVINTKGSVGDNISFQMESRLIGRPGPKYGEHVGFELKEDNEELGSFILTRTDVNDGTVWDLFHRHVPGKEYRGGSQEKESVSRISMDAVYMFLQEWANKLGKPVTCSITFSQPQVGVWALKEGFSPTDEAQRERWRRMVNGTGLMMKDKEHVYPSNAPLGVGYDKFDYEEYGFLIKFTKTFRPSAVAQ